MARLYYQRSDGPPSLGILKSTRNHGDFCRERDGFQRAAESWMNILQWIPKKPQFVESPENVYYILAPLAFQPNRESRDIPSLHSIIAEDRNRERSEAIIDQLRDAYFETFLSIGISPTSQPSMAFDHVSRILDKWPGIKRYWEQESRQNSLIFPAATESQFKAIDYGYLNPLWLLRNRNVWKQEACPLQSHFVHGDLNARNILINPQSDKLPLIQLIDFEKSYRDDLLAVDLCWLAFWLVMASGHSAKLNSPHWRYLPGCLYSAIDGSLQEPSDLGEVHLGLDLIRRLFTPWKFEPTEAEDARPILARKVVQCSLFASATAKALLHNRDHFRKRLKEDSSEKEDSSVETTDKKWAMVFYELSARAGRDLIDESKTMPGLST